MNDRDQRAGSEVSVVLSEAIDRCAGGLGRFAAASGRPEGETLELVKAVFLGAGREALADRDALSPGRLFGAARRRFAQAAERSRRDGVPDAGPEALRAIRPTEREALLVRYVGGLSWADVAIACGADEATVKERVSRALLHLTHTTPSESPATPDVQAMRRAAERRIADVMDGLAPDEMADFAVDDDATRDLVHDAEQAVGALRAGLSAHVVDAGALERDVLAAFVSGAVPPATPEPAAEPAPVAAAEPAAAPRTEPMPAVPGPAHTAALPASPAPEPASVEEKKAPEAAAKPAEKAAASAAPTTPVDGRGAAAEKAEPVPLMERLSKRGRVAVAAGSALLVAGIALALGRTGKGGADDAWSGKVDNVSLAGDGFQRCAPDHGACTAVSRGDDVPAGSTLRTDERTRAVVLLADGTRLVLDQSTELSLDGTAPRRARIATGAAILDVAELGASRARIDAPLGYAETAGAKLSLSVTSNRASNSVELEVVRGAARLTDLQERGVLVRAGESGHLDPGAAPEVFATAVFGGSLRWGERVFAPEETAAEISGLGELKAQKPGQATEQRGAVKLASHVTKVRISGNVARTEIEEEFTNGTDDVLEGIYRFPLPPDANIERLALDVDGKMIDGAFVDRERAAAIWRGAIVNAGAKKPVDEEIVWVPGPWKDPALLEWQRGGRFELRIYPIPKHGSRRVVLAYTQVLAPSGNTRRYVYPLPATPPGGASSGTRVGRFDLDVQVRGHDPNTKVVTRGYAVREDNKENGVQGFAMTAQNFEPSGDLTIEYALPGPKSEVTAWAYQPGPDEFAAAALGTSSFRDLVASPLPSPSFGGSADAAYVALALRPKLPHAEDAQRRGFAVIVDSSRSMFGERYRRASELAARLINEMDRGDRATVLACDSTCVEMPGGLAGPGPGLATAVSSFLGGITPEGGSDVTGAVRRARLALSSLPEGAARIVYVGDGTPTIGAVLPAFVAREVQSSVPRGAGTITTVPIGADADTGTLQVIAEAGGGALVPYVPGQNLREAAYAVLGATYGSTLSDPVLDLPDGLIEAAPARLPTILSGSEAIVTFRMTKPMVDGTLTLRGKVLGRPFEQRYPLKIEATTSKGNAFVPRLWAAAQIAELEKLPDLPSRQRAVRLSQQFHVASRHTSLLVLESTAMFQAFGLERRERGAQWTGEEETSSTAFESELEADKDQASGYPRERPASGSVKAKGDYDVGDDEDAYGGGAGRSLGAGPGSGSGELARREAPRDAPKASAPRKPYPASEPLAEGAPFAPPPPAAAPSPVASAAPRQSEFPAEKKRAIAVDEERPVMPRPLPPSPRRLVPMRKVWERTAKIITPVDQPAVTTELVAAAERAAAGDAAREPLKKLYTLYYRSGDVDRAGLVAERWSAKDPLDPDALTARADIAAARGDRDLAIRILGSVVDVRPGDYKAQWRLARLHRWAGRGELGCRHSSAVAQIRSTDAKVVAEAVRCSRYVGHAELANDLLSSTDDATRSVMNRLLAEPTPDPNALNGDLTLQASWEGGDDLDLSMLEPDGYRVSWLGAPTKAIISARDVSSTSREGLALKGSSVGDYVVEVTRPKGHSGTVRGSLQISAAGDKRTVPFVLEGGRARVALIKVSSHSRLVPL